MLATLFFLALASISHAATVTISASDPSISLTPGWSQQFSQSAQNSYIQTDSLLCDLTATLPPSATSVSYVGYKRAGGSTYGYTLDCEDDCILQTANGTDLSVSDDATALQSTIFSIDMDPSTQHTLRVYNIPSEASNGASKITFDHLSVLVQDHIPANNTTVVSSSITTSPTATSSSAASPTTSAIPASIPDSSTTSSITTSSQASVDVSLTLTSSSATSTGAHAVLTVAPYSAAPSSSDATAAPSSSDAAAAGTERSAPSVKNLAIGITVIALVVVGFVIVGLVIFLRQRRKRRSRSSKSSKRTDSFLPIMPPPPPVMRTASPNTISNPFSDPSSMTPAEQPFDSSASSSFVQRQMESRSGSPGSGSAPSIPLPNLPPDTRFNRMQSRPNSPVSAASKNDLWISRTPVKTQFAV